MADLVSGEAVIVDLPYARFGSRLLAIGIDLTIQLILQVIALVLLTRSGVRLDKAALAAITLTMAILVVVAYPTIFESVTRGRSPGKFALGLRVVNDNGGPETFRQALVRALAAVVEIWLLEGAPALICSLLSAKGKRLGDIFAGTLVIQERLSARSGPIGTMARQYLARLGELNPGARDELGHRIATEVAASVSPPPPPGVTPAEYLTAVLAERRSREQARRPGPRSPSPTGPGPADHEHDGFVPPV